MQHMNAHINGILKAKSAIDTSCPKTWITNTKVQDQRKREKGKQINSSNKSSRSNSIISDQQYSRRVSQSAYSTNQSSYDPLPFDIQKSNSDLQESNTKPTDKKSGGDLLDVHPTYFKKGKDPFSPRLLKTNAVSTLRSNPKVYNPLKRPSKPKLSAADKQTESSTSKKTREDNYNVQIENLDDNIRPLRNNLEESKYSVNFIEHPISDSVAENVLSSTARKIRDAEEEMIYLNFISEVTSDILSRNIFTNRVFQQVLEYHIQNNKGTLKYEQMRRAADKIRDELGIPDNNEDLPNTYGYASIKPSTFDEVDGDEYKGATLNNLESEYAQLSSNKSDGNINEPIAEEFNSEYELQLLNRSNRKINEPIGQGLSGENELLKSSRKINEPIRQGLNGENELPLLNRSNRKDNEPIGQGLNGENELPLLNRSNRKINEPIGQGLNGENELPSLNRSNRKFNEPIGRGFNGENELPSLNKSNRKINEPIEQELNNEPLLIPQKISDIHCEPAQKSYDDIDLQHRELHSEIDPTADLQNCESDQSYLKVGVIRLLNDLDDGKNQEDPYVGIKGGILVHPYPQQNSSENLDASEIDDVLAYESLLKDTFDGRDMHSPKAYENTGDHFGLTTLHLGEFENMLKRSVHFNPTPIIHEEEEYLLNDTYDLSTMKKSIDEVNDESENVTDTQNFVESQDDES